MTPFTYLTNTYRGSATCQALVSPRELKKERPTPFQWLQSDWESGMRLSNDEGLGGLPGWRQVDAGEGAQGRERHAQVS